MYVVFLAHCVFRVFSCPLCEIKLNINEHKQMTFVVLVAWSWSSHWLQCYYRCVVESLFSRVIAHTYRWSQTLGGDDPHMFHRKARFFLDNEHDFVLEMVADHLARIKACTSCTLNYPFASQ